MKRLKRFFSPAVFLSLSVLFSSAAWLKTPVAEGETDGIGQADKPAETRVSTTSFTKKLHFEPNMGQTDPTVRFLSRGKGYTLFLTSGEAIVSLRDAKTGESSENSFSAVRMQLGGANPAPDITGHEKLQGITNYYIGNNPGDWHSNIANYAIVEYHDVYPGIDLVYYGNEGRLEFDFIVSPDGNPKDILLKFVSDEKIRIDEEGNLIFSGQNTELSLKRPVAYQVVKDTRNRIRAEFTLFDDNRVGFAIGDYDPQYPLVIDPVLVYFSYLGGSDYESGNSIAVDEAGCVYITGSTSSVDFPERNGFQADLFPDGYSDVFVTKFNAGGTDIVYSTYIGGNCIEDPVAIAVDANGQVYVTGETCSWDDEDTPGYDGFPLMNACQIEYGTQYDAFITVLSRSGGLAYSTYLGGDGEDYATDIAVDNYGNVYVTGTEFSYDFPVKNAFMAEKASYYYDTFVAKIDPTKSGDGSLVYSTHLGGYYDDYSSGIAVDRYGCAYVTGQGSKDFPTTANSLQPIWQGKKDAYVTKFSADGSSLVYSTYLGDTIDNLGYDIEVDDSCCAYVSGYGPVPVTPGAFTAPGSSFLCKLNPSGTGFVYSACLNIRNLSVDKKGNIFGTYSYGWGKGGGIKALNPDGTDTLFDHRISVNPQDLAIDTSHNLYVTGNTDSIGLATENAYQKNPAGKLDAFVMKLFIEPPKDLVVKVLSDPLYDIPEPVINTLFDIYSIDLSNRANPLIYLESQYTDGEGLLHLPDNRYHPGMPVFIHTTPSKRPAVKGNRTINTSYMYKVHLDNLIIDNQGNVSAQLLETDPADTTLTYLSHASVGFSLVASIEWLASPHYVNNLGAAFIKANNMLYDVTNGQAFIDTVAIFDNKSHWKDADIQIYASNSQWPSARALGMEADEAGMVVKLPPVLYITSKYGNVNALYNAEPIDPSFTLNSSAMVHELGHYLLGFRDEYESMAGNDTFPPPADLHINFGFMDECYNLNDPRSTEMSDYKPGDPMFEHYQHTEQYQYHGQNCWEFFQDSYQNGFDDMMAFIHRPVDLGISSDNIMKGPNSDTLHPDFSVGDMMGFEFKATMTANPRRDFLITDRRSGLPLPGADNWLRKNGTRRQIHHGYANDAGRIRIFNAEAGDTILSGHKVGEEWKYEMIKVAPAVKKTEDNAQTIELKTVNGQFALLSGLAFDETGVPVYQCLADPMFSSPPSIQVSDDVSESEKQVLSASEGTYSAVFN
ncbi:MAG: cell surface glycoprotein (s-layer protein) related protein, partial [Bacteroidetes bacterium]|nr:cell surface glycoprotein (s-layer protein) related protein [Bacteroidota bacterium]